MMRYIFFGKLLCHQLKTPSQYVQVRQTSTVRRSLLYVCGDQINNLQNSPQLAVDCIVLDCEDGENEQEKNKSRQNIKQLLDNLNVSKNKCEWCVKVNPTQRQESCEDDLATVLSADNLPGSLCLPELYHPDQLHWFAERIWSHLIKRPENSRGPLKLLMLIESARAMLNLPELCKKAEDLAEMAPIFPVALMFGGVKMTANLGATKTLSGLELLYVREKLVLVAKAFGLQAIDMTYDRSSKRLFKDKCEEGVAVGFTGIQVLNPSEAILAQDIFVPTRSKVLWAKTVVRKFQDSKCKGEVNFENSEVDVATFKRAKHILQVAAAVGKIKDIDSVVRQEG